jgi:hypothetical protein
MPIGMNHWNLINENSTLRDKQKLAPVPFAFVFVVFLKLFMDKKSENLYCFSKPVDHSEWLCMPLGVDDSSWEKEQRDVT